MKEFTEETKGHVVTITNSFIKINVNHDDDKSICDINRDLKALGKSQIRVDGNVLKMGTEEYTDRLEATIIIKDM